MFTANATISYRLPTSAITINSISGEVEFDYRDTVEIQVSIEEESLPNSISILEGKDITGIICSGRLIEPTEMPTWYRVGGEYDISYEFGKSAKWYAMQPVSSRFDLESVFGIAIIGVIFRV